jgi:hypothetical protein
MPLTKVIANTFGNRVIFLISSFSRMVTHLDSEAILSVSSRKIGYGPKAQPVLLTLSESRYVR